MSRCPVWTEDMVARAAGMKRAGLSHKVISERLGVTVAAVKSKMRATGAFRNLNHRGGPTQRIGRLLSGFLDSRYSEDARGE